MRIRIRNPSIQDKVNWINIMQACNNQVNQQKWKQILLRASLPFPHVGEVEEDHQNMRHGLNEAESILDVDGDTYPFCGVLTAQPGDLLLPKALRSTLYSSVTSSQSGQNRFRISVHGVKIFKNSVAVRDT